MEPPEVGSIMYRRYDEETLRARLPLVDHKLLVIYLWCIGDAEGGGDGWRVTEVRPNVDTPDESLWRDSVATANEGYRETLFHQTLQEANTQKEDTNEEEDDDDYWAQYDATPGRTPATKRSPAPGTNHAESLRQRIASEKDYFARYGNVQPAMDGEDPEERHEELGESSLDGNALNIARQDQVSNGEPPSYSAMNGHANGHTNGETSTQRILSQPQPSSPSSNGSAAVSRLEEQVESQSSSDIGVRQHIGTSVKSLFRLGKSAGIDRAEFERIVKTELETLVFIDDE